MSAIPRLLSWSKLEEEERMEKVSKYQKSILIFKLMLIILDNILDLQPKTIHDRTQIFLGSQTEIEELHLCLHNKLS